MALPVQWLHNLSCKAFQKKKKKWKPIKIPIIKVLVEIVYYIVHKKKQQQQKNTHNKNKLAVLNASEFRHPIIYTKKNVYLEQFSYYLEFEWLNLLLN